jgi:hypothetical protein
VNIEEKCILMSQDGAGVTQVYYLRGPRKLNEERRTTHIEVSINTSLLQCGLGLKEFVSAGLNILSHHQGERSKQPLAQHDKQLFHNRQHNITHRTQHLLLSRLIKEAVKIKATFEYLLL